MVLWVVLSPELNIYDHKVSMKTICAYRRAHSRTHPRPVHSGRAPPWARQVWTSSHPHWTAPPYLFIEDKTALLTATSTTRPLPGPQRPPGNNSHTVAAGTFAQHLEACRACHWHWGEVTREPDCPWPPGAYNQGGQMQHNYQRLKYKLIL